MSNVPLPRPGPLGLIQYAGVDMQEYAAAVTAAKDAEIERLRAEVAALREDAERLEFIQNEYLHIIPFAMPTGADDSEVGWQVHIEAMNPADGFRHTEYRDNLRAAIDAARKGEA